MDEGEMWWRRGRLVKRGEVGDRQLGRERGDDGAYRAVLQLPTSLSEAELDRLRQILLLKSAARSSSVHSGYLRKAPNTLPSKLNGAEGEVEGETSVRKTASVESVEQGDLDEESANGRQSIVTPMRSFEKRSPLADKYVFPRNDSKSDEPSDEVLAATAIRHLRRAAFSSSALLTKRDAGSDDMFPPKEVELARVGALELSKASPLELSKLSLSESKAALDLTKVRFRSHLGGLTKAPSRLGADSDDSGCAEEASQSASLPTVSSDGRSSSAAGPPCLLRRATVSYGSDLNNIPRTASFEKEEAAASDVQLIDQDSLRAALMVVKPEWPSSFCGTIFGALDVDRVGTVEVRTAG